MPKKGKNKEPPKIDPEKKKNLEEEVVEATERLIKMRDVAKNLRVDTLSLQEETLQLQKDNSEHLKLMQEKLKSRSEELKIGREAAYQEIVEAENVGKRTVARLEQEKKRLEEEIIDKEGMLEKAKVTLMELEPFRKKEIDQENKIKELNEKLVVLKKEHDEEILRRRAEFVRERRELEKTYRMEISKMRSIATTTIGPFLVERLAKVRDHNSKLQKELAHISDRELRLMEERDRLIKQRNQLKWNKEFWEDISKIKIRYPPNKASRQVPKEFIEKMKSLEESSKSDWLEDTADFTSFYDLDQKISTKATKN